jgi:hypothetical protein
MDDFFDTACYNRNKLRESGRDNVQQEGLLRLAASPFLWIPRRLMAAFFSAPVHKSQHRVVSLGLTGLRAGL